jgi:hypothetical protein
MERSAQQDRIAVQIIGHKGPAFTLRVYAHMLPSSHDRARAVIGERFARVVAS